ncbi:hypothetical protein TBLA_0J00910 [Henningerozyma blattae CBS 6284]|uniref:Phospholipid/glycerol acyltransferase domain-containing protein n=1 Tax=Henningerozyma blattae (strain ATCC 34711 / CBS 6284 / DSM 70876 / NBRC 10599 / NRRL Y-10934 / UCD 77-7) TaxID=1071380 RepID=I2H9N7_HENB6|nr:hypothetical protein TBLA_0J00910 [Tetrapisispora blattae CBS 6284]CCH63089.1 hypothetical protein TBLA_0J00910 [Tetrapisispora blattae CBS 6284]
MTKEDTKDKGVSNIAAPSTHVPEKDIHSYKNPYNGFHYTFKTWLYDLVLLCFNVMYSTFFKQIEIRGGHNVPPIGIPTILVCAPHANQFIDPSLVMLKTRNLKGKRSRQTCFIVAESSLKKRFVSEFAQLTGSIPVPRPQDNLKYFFHKETNTQLKIKCLDPIDNPTQLIVYDETGESRENLLDGITKKALIGLPDYLGNSKIQSIDPSKNLIELQKPFNMSNLKTYTRLTEGTYFKYAPHIDNTQVFQNVFNHLQTKGCVGIFPEGGSHDRPSLLPIKAGVAIMALGAVAANPELKVAVLPCGLNYFHREKFRSSAVIEYGEPIIVDGKMGQEYIDNPRDSVSQLLDQVTNALFSLTVNAPDYDTLMTIQACRRLYKLPTVSSSDTITTSSSSTSLASDSSLSQNRKKLKRSSSFSSSISSTLSSFNINKTNSRMNSLPVIVELNRRMLQGYKKYKNDPKIQNLVSDVKIYNEKLYSIGLKDHQINKLDSDSNLLNKFRLILILLTRLLKLFILTLLSLPGSIIFSPVFITSQIISHKKAKEGLSKSLVKIKGTDLLATWKLLVALAMAPILYLSYSVILLYLLNSGNYYLSKIYILNSNSIIIQFMYFFSLLIITSYSSLKAGDSGFKILYSLKPLVISLISPQKKINNLKKLRNDLSNKITTICNELGPSVFPDFDKIIESSINNQSLEAPNTTTRDLFRISKKKHRKRSSSASSQISNALSTVNSRGSLTDVPLFADNTFTKYNNSLSSSSNITTDDDDDDDDHISIHRRDVLSSLDTKNIAPNDGDGDGEPIKETKISQMVRKKWETEEIVDDGED